MEKNLFLMFVSPLWNTSIIMNEFALIGYFTIKYIDKFELHNGIGLYGDRPQVWFIPNEGPLLRDRDCPQLIDSFEYNTNKMLQNFKKDGINLFLKC